jgi:DNA polymerase-1
MFENYLVLDFEVTVRCPIGTMKASPHWVGNEVVLTGYKTGRLSDANCHLSKIEERHWSYIEPYVDIAPIIVGHNLAFDLQWLKRISNGKLVLKNVWDTAIAEYVLSGQASKFPSLDELSAKYGLPAKDKRPEEMWDAGLDTTDIPLSILIPYCQQDIRNAEHIFLKQLTEAKDKGCLKLIMSLNDALMATTEMMYNGMKVDQKRLSAYKTIYEGRVAEAEKDFNKACELKYKQIFDLNSPKQISTLLFGGEMTISKKEPCGTYKSGIKAGLVKYQTLDEVKKFPGEFNRFEAEALGIEKNSFGYTVGIETIKKLKTHSRNLFVDILSEHRLNDRQLSTYFVGTNNLLYPEGYIYHNINTTATSTGRYSSSEPNLQNVTSGEDSDIKKCYISRFRENGYLIEMDFEQLEMCGLAQLSGDVNLINDISSGVDIHSELFKALFSRMPTKEERKSFKRASFALIYGAGPNKIAKTVGIGTETAKDFIKAWGKRYPQTVEFWKYLQNHCKEVRVVSDRHDPKTGKPLGMAEWQSPTGRILRFYESVAPWDTVPRFSPNELKNYPIQSFATGDVVPIYLGILYRAVVRELSPKNVVLVNTVHDSVVLDCHKTELENTIHVLKSTVKQLPIYLKNEFGIEMQVPLRAKISYGPDWQDQKEIE